MTAGKKKASSSGATPELDRKRGLVNRAGLHFQSYFTMSSPVRQFRAAGKARLSHKKVV